MQSLNKEVHQGPQCPLSSIFSIHEVSYDSGTCLLQEKHQEGSLSLLSLERRALLWQIPERSPHYSKVT